MIARPIPVLIALALLSMRLVADLANAVNEPRRWWAHALLAAAAAVAVAGAASRRARGWWIAELYCSAQTLRFAWEFRQPSFVGLLALMVAAACTLLLLHPESRADFG